MPVLTNGDRASWANGTMIGEVVRVVPAGDVPWTPKGEFPKPRKHESYVIFGGPHLADGTALTPSLHWPEVKGLVLVEGKG